MKSLALLLLGLLALYALPAQSWTGPVVLPTDSNLVDFEVDNLGNLYLVDDKGRIKKRDAGLDSTGTFNEIRSYGRLYKMDVSNPLRVILWYKDFGILILLDRFLNQRNLLDLRKIGVLQCNAVGQSYDNNIWIYDDLAGKVLKMDESGRVLLESADFRIAFDEPPHPEELIDFNKQLYAYDPAKGLLIMDYFGAWKSKLAYLHWQNLQPWQQGLAAVEKNQLILLNKDGINNQYFTLPAPLATGQKIKLHANRLYFLNAQGRIQYYTWHKTGDK